jgi:conjugative transfer signal peptidase TraF
MSSSIRKRALVLGFPSAILLTLIWYLLPLTFNWSPSVPVGVYWMTADRNAPYLAFCMSADMHAQAVAHGYQPLRGKCPDGTAWILKPNLQHVHVITLSSAGFVIDNHMLPNTAPLAKDRFGRVLPHYRFGTYLASDKEVWVVSSYNKRSYDSRYFGPVSTASIVAYARPFLVAP